MDEVTLGVVLATLMLLGVLGWRIWEVENNLDERITGIDHSLAVIVGVIMEKIDTLGSRVPDINLINQNPLAQIFEAIQQFKTGGINNGHPKPRATNGQFETIEVEENATTEEEKEN